ncbi:DUF502 domain-containing protein [Balneola sp. MJW-20]|uniref:DUF502 domain-containing protein n=1 Tax=Gracilimonas aurantiaca TaxID=3234185 RepID=UPI00346718CA
MKTILNYFLRGLLIVFPLGATIYLTIVTIDWMNDVFNKLFFQGMEFSFPGLGILTGFTVISLVGFIFTRAFTRPIVHMFEKLFTRTPLVSIVYSSLKDLTEALVGDKKKFTKPVYISIDDTGIKRFGFVTEDSLSHMGLEGDVAVYCPHSYNVSGNLYIVPKDKVQPIKTNSTNFMRFIVSGGVTQIHE